MTNLITTAQDFATAAHAAVNQRYDEHPYSYHLAMVAGWAGMFLHLLPERWHHVAVAGAWVHDTIEDAQQTYNDVVKAVGEEVAEVAYALTNEKGRNRAERANAKYYAGIRAHIVFAYVKICDRLANAEYSVSRGSRMAEMYRKEFAHFKKSILGGDTPETMEPHLLPLVPMMDELAKILGM